MLTISTKYGLLLIYIKLGRCVSVCVTSIPGWHETFMISVLLDQWNLLFLEYIEYSGKGKHFCLLWLICSSSGSTHGSGRQSPQGSSREGCCGAKKEWIPRGAREAATADWQNPVLAQLSDGKCQQSTSGREGKAFPNHNFLWDSGLPKHTLQQKVMLMCCSLQSMLMW